MKFQYRLMSLTKYAKISFQHSPKKPDISETFRQTGGSRPEDFSSAGIVKPSIIFIRVPLSIISRSFYSRSDQMPGIISFYYL